uniref:Reverse transcriptase zinc-binding domain-containing protein n=1 Tax=Cannabis sativa TaxID=3483 RepID=A0A803Q484_CANSA
MIATTSSVANATGTILIDGVTKTITELNVVGSIAGTQGLPTDAISGVSVVLLNTVTNQVLATAVTNEDGLFKIIYIPTDIITFLPLNYVVSTVQSAGLPVGGVFKAPLGQLSILTNLINLLFVSSSNFKRSTLPFTYPGIPICSKKISRAECQCLLEKMTSRIKMWSTKNLSYMRRVTLINSVLLAIHTYWAQIFILPKKLLKDIEATCRSFLWKGTQDGAGSGLVAWDYVCRPKAAGGLGFRNVQHWNMATLGSWAWRKIVAVKNKIQQQVSLTSFVVQKYKIQQGYNLLFAEYDKLPWSNLIWDRLIVPKHRFILWLVLWDRLNTRERLSKFMTTMDAKCVFCSKEEETIAHLFFECDYSRSFLQEMKKILK